MRGSLSAIRFSGAGLFFAGGALLALLAAFSIYGYLSAAVPKAEVWVVTRDLPPGTRLTRGDLEIRTLPSAAVPGGSIRDRQAAVGQRVRFGVARGDVLRQSHLVPEGDSDIGRTLAEHGSGYRAVTLPGEMVPAVDRLIPGDRLELIGVLPVQDEVTHSYIAMPLGTAIVIEVIEPKGQTEHPSVLVAMEADNVSGLALTMRTGSLMVTVQGEEETVPVAPLSLEELTAAARTAAGAEESSGE